MKMRGGSGSRAVMIAAAAGRSREALSEALAPAWDLPRITDEHGAYGDKDRQSDHVHHLRSVEELVFA